ncbi:hypothetical protein ABPG72_005509 [Tetrahymena utriculariae]
MIKQSSFLQKLKVEKIKSQHIALEDVQNLFLKPFNQIYVIDLNRAYLQTLDQQIDQRQPKEEIVEFLSQINIKANNMVQRIDMIINLLLQQQIKRNPLLKQLTIFGIKGQSLIQLFQSQNFQKDETTFDQIKQMIVKNITTEKGDVGSALYQFLQNILPIIRSGQENRSLGSVLEVFFFMNGSEITQETENKCLEELSKLKLSTDKVSISYRVSDFYTSQNSIRKILSLQAKDLYSEDIGQLQYFSWLELNFINQMLDIIQNKKINKYESSARLLKQYHEECTIKIDSLIKHFKTCQDVSGELPIEDNKVQERKTQVDKNMKILKEVNEQLNQISIAHPKLSIQQILFRKKMILRLIHIGVNLEEEKNIYQYKAQNLMFEKHEMAKQFSEFLYELKSVVDGKLEIFSGELLLNDVTQNTIFLFDYLKSDLQYTKKIFETCQEINAKIFIMKKNVEKCNQKDLVESIDTQIKQIQSTQFRLLRNIENSIVRVFISLQQILDCMGFKNIKINSKKKAVFDELTNLVRANSDYQSYLPSNSEGVSLGRSFKIIIESYFKEFLK